MAVAALGQGLGRDAESHKNLGQAESLSSSGRTREAPARRRRDEAAQRTARQRAGACGAKKALFSIQEPSLPEGRRKEQEMRWGGCKMWLRGDMVGNKVLSNIRRAARELVHPRETHR